MQNRFKEYYDQRMGDKKVYGTALLLAGCEDQDTRDDFHRIGIRRILVSYYYLRKKIKKMSLSELADDFSRFDFVFMDSGGFTLLQQLAKGKQVESILEYNEDYLEFLDRTRDIWHIAAEVDVVNHDREGNPRPGLEREYMERTRLEALKTGIRICPVYQGEGLVDYVQEWLENYPYIAIGSIMNGNNILRYKKEELIHEARKRNILLHGLAMTDATSLKRGIFYTVDSTSWSSGSRYGNTHIFQSGRIRVYDKDKKDVRKRYKGILEDHGINWANIVQEKKKEVDLMNAVAWKQYADYVSLKVQSAYWLSEEEKEIARKLRVEENSHICNAKTVVEEMMEEKLSDEKLTEENFSEEIGIEETYSEETVIDEDNKELDIVNNKGIDPFRGTGGMVHDARLLETMFCDNCFLTGKCPAYKANSRCSFRFSTKVDNPETMLETLQGILQLQGDRVMRGALFEKIEQGVIDKNLSGEIKMFMDMMALMKQMFEKKETIKIEASGGPGIIAQIFGNKGVS